MGFDSYSATPGSNTSVNGINIAEGCPASSVNDALRQIAADGRTAVNSVQLATYIWGGTSTGSANVQAVTISPAPAALAAGLTVKFIPGFTNTAACTFQVNSLTATAVRNGPSNVALNPGDIIAGHPIEVIFDGTFWRLSGLPFGNPHAIGEIKAFMGTAAPAGWLLCNGQNVSRATYAALFARASTTFGAGDGSTTFGVPDLRGRAIFGKDDMGGSAASRITATSGITGTTLGAAGGDERLLAHAHTQQGTFSSGNVSADHAHSYNSYSFGGQNFNAGSADTFALNGSTTIGSSTGGISANHFHNTTISGNVSTSGAGGAQNMPPAFILNYILFAGA